MWWEKCFKSNIHWKALKNTPAQTSPPGQLRISPSLGVCFLKFPQFILMGQGWEPHNFSGKSTIYTRNPYNLAPVFSRATSDGTMRLTSHHCPLSLVSTHSLYWFIVQGPSQMSLFGWPSPSSHGCKPFFCTPSHGVSLMAEHSVPCSAVGHLFIPSMNTDQAFASKSSSSCSWLNSRSEAMSGFSFYSLQPPAAASSMVSGI